MNVQSFEIARVPILGLPLGCLENKCHLDVALLESHIILQGREWYFLPKVAGHVKFMLEVVHTKFVTPHSTCINHLISLIVHFELLLMSSS
jgi:hypothetical protein